MIGEEIIIEIDSTLDQLIANAEAIRTVNLEDLSETEIAAFQKTQESLLHRLLRMDDLLEANRSIPGKKSEARSQMQKKLSRLASLKVYEVRHKKAALLSKRRGKRLFTIP